MGLGVKNLQEVKLNTFSESQFPHTAAFIKDLL